MSVASPYDVRVVPVDAIRVTGDNMRLDSADVEELAESIRTHGLQVPLLVDETNKGLLLIGGHRRLAACRRIGLGAVPVLVRRYAPGLDRLVAALIENVQRKDLTPLEEGRAFARLRDEGMTQYEIAASVGKGQKYVHDRLRLLELPEVIQEQVHKGELPLYRAVEPGRTPRDRTGRERAPDLRDPAQRWLVQWMDRILQLIELGKLPRHVPEVVNRLELLRKALNALAEEEVEHVQEIEVRKRQCSHSGCSTVLSRFNRTDYCAPHERVHARVSV